MSFMSSALALGVFPGLWISGYCVLRRLTRGLRLPVSRFSAACLAPALTLPFWSLVLTTSAHFDTLSCVAWGAFGWLLSLALGVYALRRPWLGQRQSWLKRLLLAAVTLVALGLYAAFPNDSFFVGRDQGTYSNQALHIAHTGQLKLDWPQGFDDPKMKRKTPPGWGATGIYPGTASLTIQFSPVLPVWLAFAFSSFGVHGLFGFNALVATLCIGVFFALASRLIPRRMALVATAFFALNPMQIWIARVALSEVLAQYLLLSGALLLLLLCRARPRLGWLLGAFVVGSSVFVRIDGFVLAPLALAFGWFSAIGAARHGELPSSSRDSTRGLVARVLAVRPEVLGVAGIALSLSLGWVLYVLTTMNYVRAQSAQLIPIGQLSAALLVLWIVLARFAPTLPKKLVSLRGVWVVLAAALALLSIYAYFIRPELDPYVVRVRRGVVLPTPIRDFRENSFVNLGVYVTPVLAFLAPAGLWLALRRTVLKRRPEPMLFFLILCFGYSLLYLYRPAISADHPWGMRRFVPIVIPGVVLLSLVAFDGLRRFRIVQRYRQAWTAALAVALLAFTAFRARPYLFLKEYDGAYAFVTRLADSIPSGRFVICNMTSRTFGHLVLGRGLRALRYDLYDSDRLEVAQRAVDLMTAPNEPYYVLTDAQSPLDDATPIAEFNTTQRWLEETTSPPAEKIREGNFSLLLYERRGPLSVPAIDLDALGVRRVARVKEGGFWGTERDGDGITRWTKGEAWLEIPLSDDVRPRRLKLRIIGFAPSGAWLTVLANGTAIHSDSLDEAPVTLDLALPESSDPKLRIDLVSDTFRPSDAGSQDTRELGIRLSSMVLE